MARRNESLDDKRRRELVQGFLKDSGPNDIQELMKEMIRQVLQGGLEAEPDDVFLSRACEEKSVN